MSKKNNNIFTEEAKEIIKKRDCLDKDIEEILEEYDKAFAQIRKASDDLVYRIMRETETYGDAEKAIKYIVEKMAEKDTPDYEFRASRDLLEEVYKNKLARYSIGVIK